MIHDPHYQKIIDGLSKKPSPDTFELCMIDLIRKDGLNAVPIVGGSDSGMDGAVADGQGEPFPIVTTTGKDCIGNLTRNLNQYIKDGRKRRKLIFATSQALSPTRQTNLHNRAGELGFSLVQLYERSIVAMLLYREPQWCKDLLHITGRPSALSIIPETHRQLFHGELIGRDEAFEWLQSEKTDKLITGQPGSGKTSLLYKFAQQDSALFVIEKDRERIANAIREQNPDYIIIDDAHVDRDFLLQIKRLRIEINADFRLIATCWPNEGEKNRLVNILELSPSAIFDLKRLTRDEMVRVIESAGIRGVNWLIRSIVDQAEGLPGLAVSLTKDCIRRGVGRIQTAETLRDIILDSCERYVRQEDKYVKPILASFSLGGDAGMSKSIVSEILEIKIIDLRDILAKLDVGGVIYAQHDADLLIVRPRALRSALINDIFFSDASSLPRPYLEGLVNNTSNIIETMYVLIEAKLRGGNIDDRYLRGYLEQLPTVERIWNEYAWVSQWQAEWVLENFQGFATQIAQPCLHNCPKQVIPRLLDESIGDNRLLNATPEHPLRILEDWVQRALPDSEEASRRRRIIFDNCYQWLIGGNDSEVGYKAILFALDPRFEDHVSDPGSGDRFTMRSRILSSENLAEIQTIWPKILELTKTIPVQDWQPFLSTLRDWAYPLHVYSDDIHEILKNFAKQMAYDIRELAKGDFNALHNLRDTTMSLIPDFVVEIDTEIEILYPRDDFDRDWQQRNQEQITNAHKLAEKWVVRSVESSIHSLVEIENKMIGNYPCLVGAFCAKLAELTNEPFAFVNAILDTQLQYYVISPFLQKIVDQKQEGWEFALERCFKTKNFAYTAMDIVLLLENPPPHLLDKALELLSVYLSHNRHLPIWRHLPDNLLLTLLEHPNQSISEAAALAEWSYEEKVEIRDWLRPAWEKAVVYACKDEYWLSEIFKSESHLAFEWLKLQLNDDEFAFYLHKKSVTSAISVLRDDEKRQILYLIPESKYGYDEFIAQLISDNVQLYSELLSLKQLSEYHLAPIYSTEMDEAWSQKAKLALEASYDAKEIAYSTMRLGHTYGWSGKESNYHKAWLDRFQTVVEHEDNVIRQIAFAGVKMCDEAYKRALDNEHDNDVYGRY